MKIAQVAPLYESGPPRYHGGKERAVSYLTKEVVRQRHEVPLVASRDSETKTRLVRPLCRRSLRLDKRCQHQLTRHLVMLENVFRRADAFDIIQFHAGYLDFPLSREAIATKQEEILEAA